MKNGKTLLIIVLFFLLLLLGLYFLASTAEQGEQAPRVGRGFSHLKNTPRRGVSRPDFSQAQELYEPPQASRQAAAQRVQTPGNEYARYRVPSQPRGTVSDSRAAVAPSAYKGRFSTGNTSSQANTPYTPKGFAPANYGRFSAAGNSAGNSTYAPYAAEGQNAYQATAAEQMQRERKGALAPYLSGLKQKEREQLENSLKGLSNGINRALAKAMLPKSKKEANIEKYLQRNSPAAVSAGPFAPVLEQVAAQKANVVNEMKQAYGAQAGAQAGKIMDSFQSEVASAINTPGQTNQQIAEKVKAVSQKYSGALQKMSEQNSFKQFEQERIQKDNALQQELEKHYGADISAQAGQILAAAREKDMQLARQGLPVEEYYKQQLANQTQRRKDLQQMLAQNGKSSQGLFAAEDALEQQDVQNRLKDEEEGKTLGSRYRPSEEEMTAIDQSLRQERDEKLQAAGAMYGEDGARKIDQIYQRYYDQYMKIWNDPETSKTEKQSASFKLRQGVNQELENLQQDPKMQQERVTRQVDGALNQMMQDPAFANASDEAKNAWQQHARPVLEQMYTDINDVMNSNLPEAEKQRRVEALQQRAQAAMSH